MPTLHLTLVEGDFEGDVYFPVPVLDSPDWIMSSTRNTGRPMPRTRTTRLT